MGSKAISKALSLQILFDDPKDFWNNIPWTEEINIFLKGLHPRTSDIKITAFDKKQQTWW